MITEEVKEEIKPERLNKEMRFYRMPLSFTDKGKAETCHDRRGHVLAIEGIEGREICCARCPARWRNEGF